MNQPSTRVLGIDTSLRSTGYGVVERRGSRLHAVTYGRIRSPARVRLSECLQRLSQGLDEVVRKTEPVAAAVEGVFYCRNAKTALALGEARGVAIAACVEHGLPVFEYAPRRVKQAVVGFGGAEKQQVNRMVMSLLGLSDAPKEDEGDALAIGICHLHNNRTGHPLLEPREL